MPPLFPALAEPSPDTVFRVAGRSIPLSELREAVTAHVEPLRGLDRVAVHATSELETVVGVLAGLAAGAAVVPVNPKAGERELAHVLADSRPSVVLAGAGTDLPAAFGSIPRLDVDCEARDGGTWPAEPPAEAAALILYTSGTTGLPKGAILPRRAISSNLDALAEVWGWTSSDVLVHGLPLFHAHGLVLGTLGPARLGCGLVHLGRFSPEAAAAELDRGATMLFAVPTMVHRLADAAEADPSVAEALRGARVLVSGSAALPAREHERVERLCGQRIVERYGMTETLMNCSARLEGDRRPGCVGLPLPGVEIRLADDNGIVLDAVDDETIGEIQVRGPNLFAGYLGRPEETAAVMREGGWFATGDLATRAADGVIRIVGRRSTDLIKTGGYRVGAGEVEGALLEHPAVAECAVTGEPDDDLGERIVAWVVLRPGEHAGAVELEEHVARLLTPHKRPRLLHFVAALPRNELGKVQKTRLRPEGGV